jgi:plastocyanin
VTFFCVTNPKRSVTRPLLFNKVSAPRNICGNKRYGLLKATLAMTESLKPKRRKTHIVTTSLAYYPRSATRCVTVLTPFLRHLNTGTLAILLFVALAFLTSIRGGQVGTNRSIPVEADKKEIAIANFNFSPKMFTVSAGATVTWINHDKVPHVISSAEKSILLQPGQSFSNTFATGRTYSYFCSIQSPNDRTNHRQVNVQPYHT